MKKRKLVLLPVLLGLICFAMAERANAGTTIWEYQDGVTIDGTNGAGMGRIDGTDIKYWHGMPTNNWIHSWTDGGGDTHIYEWRPNVSNTLTVTGDATFGGGSTWGEVMGANDDALDVNSLIVNGNSAASQHGKTNGTLDLNVGVGKGQVTVTGRVSMETAITASGTGTTTIDLSNMATGKGLLTTDATGFNAAANLTTNTNIINVLNQARVGTNGIITANGETKNKATFDIGMTADPTNDYVFKGQLDISGTNSSKAGAINQVDIKSGRLDRGATDASIKTSTGNNTKTSVNITGGWARYIETGGGIIDLTLTGGNYNFLDPGRTGGDATNKGVGITGQDFNTYTTTKGKQDLVAGSTAKFSDGTYMVYTLLNIGDTVTVDGDAYVTIGVIDYHDNDLSGARYGFDAKSLAWTSKTGWDYSVHQSNGREAQISADTVNVSGTLVIHENINNWGLVAPQANESNIINTLNVGGRVTLDRTSIHASAGDAEVNVFAGGTLHGFGHFGGTVPGNDLFGDKTPMRPNVNGNVTLKAGGIDTSTGRITQEGGRIQPYNSSLFRLGWETTPIPGSLSPNYEGERNKAEVEKLMGVVFQTSKDFKFDHTSVLSTRLFAERDLTNDPETKVWFDGLLSTDKKDLFYSDAVLANKLVFTDIATTMQSIFGAGISDLPIRNTVESKTAQSIKVQYDPVFGLHNELKSKLDFKLYEGDGSHDDQNTNSYYFNVASSLTAISELNGYEDANHLFNRMILKSDMLGEWTFLYDEDKKNIVLRYRVLAEHPQNGGLVIRETERNNILVAKYLDEIRYPFLTDTSMLNLPKDYAGDIQGLDYDNSSWYDDKKEYNAGDASNSNKLDDGKLIYNHEGYHGDMVKWYADASTRPGAATQWTNEYMEDWEDLLLAFQLELQNGGAGMSRGLRMLHAEPYANLSESTFNTMGQFIRNRERNSVTALYQVENPDYPRDCDAVDTMFDPILDAGRMDRFVQNPIRFWASGFGTTGSGRKSGTEYGFDQKIWGGALGVVKEFGDLYAGLTLGYAHARNEWDDIPSAGSTKSYLGEALLGYRLPGMFFAEAHLNYSYGEQEMNRYFDVANYYTGHAKGDFKDHMIAGGFRIGWQKPFWGSWLFLPTLGVQVMHYRAGAFTETGRANMAPLLKIHEGDMNRTMYRVPLMARLSRAWAINNTMVLTPEIRAGITPLFGNKRGKVKAEWRGNPFPDRTFISYGVDRGSYEAELGATIELSRKGRFYVAGNYDLVYSENNTMHNFSLQAGLNF